MPKYSYELDFGGGDVSTTTTPAATTTAVSTTTVTSSESAAPSSSEKPTTTAIPPIPTIGPRKCGNVEDTDICYYENSREPCDICEGVMCPVGKKCVKRDKMCLADCVCEKDTDVVDKDGICRNPCYKNQCQNGGSCVVDANKLSKFRCECLKEYEGVLCENMHNFCLDPKPSFCPAGQYTCQMLGFQNYTCECAEGFFYDISGKTCVKVGEIVNITLVFKQTYYSELYNNVTHPEAIEARRTISAAFSKIYGDHLIRLVFDNFTQGSLVANMKLMLKLDDSGAFRSNERIFKQFLLDCDTQNTACFGSLGKAYLPYDGWAAKDERCGNVVCPQYTVCEPIDGQPGKTQCVCIDGFEATGSTVDNQGRLIQLCEDIDECALNPCPTVEECQNTPGNFTCTQDTTIATCPSGSKIVVTGPFSYRCECSWIYAGSDCRFPLSIPSEQNEFHRISFPYIINSKRPWTKVSTAARRSWAETQGLFMLTLVVSAQERRAAVPPLVYDRLEFAIRLWIPSNA
ncbi:hypothetical protein Y032_0250g151 [Ancylostoma ceylanicum]|uniref:EGF-like domain-containing protein n=1 Tax=Ancylostoma ceylanicum TaxID=53326 RepID=A0A016SCZ7_9BILA|nr:hypothetical protein Y032_0250g151 [Ancylostoma ceylanicum]